MACMSACSALPTRPLSPWCGRLVTARIPYRQQHLAWHARYAWRCRASQEQDKADADSTTGAEKRQAAPPQAPPSPPAQAPSPRPPEPEGGLAKGQTTAIVTGVVSILFGVAYLALVQLMDSRGDQLLPPPPEAFGL